ncbi:MAG: hypothetical protein WCR46_26400 [Deltaproteobacteria bacterium]
MTNIKMVISGTVIYLFISGCVLPALALDLDSFTQADRERLVRMETTQTVFMQQMDKRLEQVDRRIEQVDKRFEQVDKRFEELRADMNARFEQTTNMFYVLSVIFTTLFAAVFSFAWWDRRSVLITARKAAKEVVEEKTQDIEKIRLTVEQVVKVLRRHADKTPAFRDIMQRAHLL